MAWDLGLDLEGANDRAPLLPAGKHLVEITNSELTEKEGVGARVKFSLTCIDGKHKGSGISLAPYVPGKDFKGKDTQKQWAKDVWHNLVKACGIDPAKVKGKPADKIGAQLVGRVLVVEVETSPAKETDAERAARERTGGEPKVFTNVRTMARKETYDGAVATAAEPVAEVEVEVDVPTNGTAPAADDDTDGFSLEDMA